MTHNFLIDPPAASSKADTVSITSSSSTPLTNDPEGNPDGPSSINSGGPPSIISTSHDATSLTSQSPDPLDGAGSPFAFEARTLPNVLRRISSLIAMGSNVSNFIKA